ncbi:MAG: LPS export ABC transporter permease LptG [Desulfobacterales bacterium]|nr:LPS export ABC transporter permease LptG [Desulfobacterales bacterium]
MLIINYYISRQVIKYFFVVLIAVTTIYVTVDFFERIDNLMRVDVGSYQVFIFFISKIPLVVVLLTPVGVLLSILIALGIMNKNNEIIALKSGGVSIYALLKPVLSLGLIFTFFIFFVAEIIVPITISKANFIWQNKEGTVVASRENNIWIRQDRLIANIKYFIPTERTAYGLTLSYFDHNFNLVRRIDAKRGTYTEDKWVLYEVLEQTLTNTGDYNVKVKPIMEEKIELLPDDLKKVIKKTEEMGFFELKSYIKKVQSEGYDAKIYKVDLYSKISFPFVCIIMVIVGTGIAVKDKNRKKNMASNIVIGIGIAFCYWISHSFCMSLGYAEILSPQIAAWATNMIFLCFGIILIIKAE